MNAGTVYPWFISGATAWDFWHSIERYATIPARSLLYRSSRREMHRPHYHIIAGFTSEDVSLSIRALMLNNGPCVSSAEVCSGMWAGEKRSGLEPVMSPWFPVSYPCLPPSQLVSMHFIRRRAVGEPCSFGSPLPLAAWLPPGLVVILRDGSRSKPTFHSASSQRESCG